MNCPVETGRRVQHPGAQIQSGRLHRFPGGHGRSGGHVQLPPRKESLQRGHAEAHEGHSLPAVMGLRFCSGCPSARVRDAREDRWGRHPAPTISHLKVSRPSRKDRGHRQPGCEGRKTCVATRIRAALDPRGIAPNAGRRSASHHRHPDDPRLRRRAHPEAVHLDLFGLSVRHTGPESLTHSSG